MGGFSFFSFGKKTCFLFNWISRLGGHLGFVNLFGFFWSFWEIFRGGFQYSVYFDGAISAIFYHLVYH